MNENVPMTAQELTIRSYLSPAAVTAFDDMYYWRALGAASNIRAIGSMYADIAATAVKKGLDSSALIARVDEISRYFIEKRGASSHAIVTAIQIMTAGLHQLDQAPAEETCAFLAQSYQTYETRARGWMDKIREYGWNVLRPMEKILLFDYSSTVNAMMETARAHGKTLDVYIPESRALDGGHQFLKNGVRLQHRMHYFPDAAIPRFVEKIDAAFIGAETFFPNGSLANTVGSDLTAIACQYYKKPLYVPTSLIKLDPRGFFGCTKQESYEDARDYFGLQLEDSLREKVDLCMPGLITVPAALISAFITEEGVVPPGAMYTLSRDFVRRMEQEEHA